MKHRIRIVFAAAATLVASSAVRAETITAEFVGVTPSTPTVSVTRDGQAFNNILAGWINWTNVQPPNSALAPGFASLCAELGKSIDAVSTFETRALTPYFSNTVASQVKEFWGENIGAVNNDPNNAIAFQLGMWEIIHETSGTLDMTNGNVVVTDGPANQLQLGQQWLSQVNGQGTFEENLIVLDSLTGQDQIVPYNVVPVPPAVVLGGMGLISLVGYGIRRRRNNKKPLAA